MKLIHRLSLAASVLLVAASARADYVVTFFNFNAGNSLLGVVYDTGGVTPLGSGFSAQIYAGASAGSLAAIGSRANFIDGTGIINAGDVSVTSASLNAGSLGAYQLKAWDNVGGTITSYEAAVAAGRKVGESAIVGLGGTVQTSGFVLGGTIPGTPPTVVTATVNLHPSFSVALVPEPGLMTLGLLGAAGLFLRRRRD
ncbi:MAG: hypothetical protein FJ386_06615 [Verrucomicrobia bacterium]|nr:hypothetical protein [Verrucomicrobiota bacterium]